MFERELSVAVSAVTTAAGLCVSVRESSDPSTLHKGDRSPVTVADFGSQALVCRTLEESFEADPVIAEESAAALRIASGSETRENVLRYVRAVAPGASDEQVFAWIDRGAHVNYSDRFWTLDPIDGTRGFLRGDQYVVALALVEKGIPVVACLACPNLQDGNGGVGVLVTAVRGQGTKISTLFGPGGPHPVSVSFESSVESARFCESVESEHSSHEDAAAVAAELGMGLGPVRMDSQAKYAVVARGDADIYLRLPARINYSEKIWDHAAGSLVVEEAGGRVTDIDGRALDFSCGQTLVRNRGIIATNGVLHDRVLAAIARIGIGV